MSEYGSSPLSPPDLLLRQRQMLRGLAPHWRRADAIARAAGLSISYRAARRTCERLTALGLAEAAIAQGGADFRLTAAGEARARTWHEQKQARDIL